MLLESFRLLFEVNVMAALRLTQLVIPIMRRQRSGSIVNIGSVAGDVSLPWAAGYAASKYALHGITDSLRRELRREGIRVVKVCPGIVATDFRKHVLFGSAPSSVKNLRPVVSAEAVADAVLRGVESGSSCSIYVPRIGRAFSVLGTLFPGVMDWYLGRLFVSFGKPVAVVGSMVSEGAESGEGA
jgi:short-subunit dehydrogenase